MLDTTREAWPPNYAKVYGQRNQQLLKIKEDAVVLYGAMEYYRTRPIEFIEDWCSTLDPRNAGSGALTRMPFCLFSRQREFIEFLWLCVQTQSNGLVEKSRDMGATWLCCAFSVWMWLFIPGSSVGWGSRKAELVDRLGEPDSIFEKLRILINLLPVEFLPAGFRPKDHMTYMRIVNPANGSTITGESGDNIGRGGRKTVHFNDESAHYVHPEAIEAALGDNTRVLIDISSVLGTGTVFHRKREAGVDWAPGQPVIKGKTNVFVMDWRDHPAKTQEWYDERRKDAEDKGLLHLFAQEVDRDYSAALEGVIIPAQWVKAAVDAHVKLGFDDSGRWGAALDVADEGGDTNALAKRKGVILHSCEEWGDRDTGETARRAVAACRDLGHVELQYDCIGVGAGVKAETNRLAKEGDMPRGIRLVPWNAGAAVLLPEGRVIPYDKQSPKNEDFYTNIKAQAWWSLRRRFELTYRAVRSIADDATEDEKAFTWRADDLISLPSTLPNLRKIEKELSQATASQGSRLKLIVDKSPEGTKSPNCFVAGTMVRTPTGERPIETLRIGDEVTTPFGASKVIYCWKSPVDEVCLAEFSNGRKLVGTPDHNVFVWGKGKVKLGALSASDQMEGWSSVRRMLWQSPKKFAGMAGHTLSIVQVGTIRRGLQTRPANGFFIALCGYFITGQFLMALKSITKTAIGEITTSPILNSWSRPTTPAYTFLNTGMTLRSVTSSSLDWTALTKPQRFGTDHQTDLIGTANTASVFGKIANLVCLSVKCATQNLRAKRSFLRGFARLLASRNLQPMWRNVSSTKLLASALTATKNLWHTATASSAVVPTSVRRESVKPTNVFNITLAQHNAYYANDLLVFNCADAIVMCFWPMPSTAFVVNQATLARAQGQPALVAETPNTPSSPLPQAQAAVRVSSNLLAQVRNRR